MKTGWKQIWPQREFNFRGTSAVGPGFVSYPIPDTPADALAARSALCFAVEKLRAHGAMAALSTDDINNIAHAGHENQNLKPEAVISTVGEVINRLERICRPVLHHTNVTTEQP